MTLQRISSIVWLLALAGGISAAFAAEQNGSAKSNDALLVGAALSPVESVKVPASGEAAVFKTSLDQGQLYLLKATGAVAFGSKQQDAEYGGFSADGAGASDKIGDADVGIDIGVKEILPANGRKAAPPSENRVKWFGDFRPDHVYYLLVTGAGQPLSLKLTKPTESAAGTGTITVSLFRLLPDGLGEALEKVMVPAREKISVDSKMNGDSKTVYLLQAAGEVQVGGPGHMGDAEFHDYHRDGTGYNEGEGGVDFGVGIDEPIVGVGHDPRTHKWGPYRTDHTYYMLYAGTGKPIGFNYHDTGGKSGAYLDNEGFLPVQIFRVP